MIESVDKVVIPVKVASTWFFYLTQRSTKQQSVIRVTKMIRKVEASNGNAHGAVLNLDRIKDTQRVSVTAIWLISLVDCLRGQGSTVSQ